MKKTFFLFFVSTQIFFAQEIKTVAVIGGMWPMPPLLKVWTDAKIIAMPKASINSIENSIMKDFFPEIKEVKIGSNGNTDNIEELLQLNASLYICHKAEEFLCQKLSKVGKESLSLSINIDNYNSKKTLAYWLENLAQYFPIETKNQKLI
ncbi:hypothetical protein OQH60_08505, partial [Campylobacter sp. MIT 21-1685]|nr:hypothetical protein [Campylobacter sp. MIT 21-1684]MCX2752179.1 hypothetical protein [Campylobacter sp. MIT 21-1682]MCX2808374.1 hypothetical protein [Campylobacter sp. MIT 21-1685]